MQSSDRIVLALVASTCGVEAATAVLTFAILSFNWCNTCCLCVRSLRDECCKVTTCIKYAQAFRHSIFLRVHLLFWLRAPPPLFKIYFTVSKAFGAQANFNFNFTSLFCKGELWSSGKEASVCPSEAGYICEAHLYYTGSPLPTCILGGADHCSGDRRAWQGMIDPQAAPVSQHTAVWSAWRVLSGDVQMNPASSIIHSYVSSNRFGLCLTRYRWDTLSRGASGMRHKQWKLKPNYFVYQKKVFPHLQNSWKQLMK